MVRIGPTMVGTKIRNIGLKGNFHFRIGENRDFQDSWLDNYGLIWCHEVNSDDFGISTNNNENPVSGAFNGTVTIVY